MSVEAQNAITENNLNGHINNTEMIQSDVKIEQLKSTYNSIEIVNIKQKHDENKENGNYDNIIEMKQELQPNFNKTASSTPTDIVPKNEIKTEAQPVNNVTKSAPSNNLESTTLAKITSELGKKRQHALKIEEMLACEEAKYTVLKKIRLSQLSAENQNKADDGKKPNNKLKNKIKEENNSRSASERNTPNGRRDTPTGKGKIDNSKFKPINPPGSSKFSNNIIVPKAKPFKNMKSFSNGRDLEDIHQLAIYLAQNQNVTELDKTTAKRMVFRKQLQKVLNNCPPPEPEKSDVIFFPSINSSEFVNLIGLEQVVNNIKIMNAKKKGVDKLMHGHLENAEDWKVKESEPTSNKPFECIKCSIDFSPQWFNSGISGDSPSVYCQNCVITNRKKHMVKKHNKQVKKVFNEALEVEKELDSELNKEYDKQSEIVKVEMKKAEITRQHLLDLQKKKLTQQRKSDDKSGKRTPNEKKDLNQKPQVNNSSTPSNKNSNGKRQNTNGNIDASTLAQLHALQNPNQTSSSNSNHALEVLQKLIVQITKSGVLNTASQSDVQKILHVLQQQLQNAGIKSPEMVKCLHVYFQQFSQEQRQKQEKEAKERAEREEAQRRALEARTRRNEEARRKKADEDQAIQQLLALIANTPNQEQQHHLLQMLIQNTNNNPDAQKRLIEQVMKMICQRQQNGQTNSRR